VEEKESHEKARGYTKVWFQQFVENFVWGTIISAFWFYCGYKLFDGFWEATILTNVVTFYIGRLVFRHGSY